MNVLAQRMALDHVLSLSTEALGELLESWREQLSNDQLVVLRDVADAEVRRRGLGTRVGVR